MPKVKYPWAFFMKGVRIMTIHDLHIALMGVQFMNALWSNCRVDAFRRMPDGRWRVTIWLRNPKHESKRGTDPIGGPTFHQFRFTCDTINECYALIA